MTIGYTKLRTSDEWGIRGTDTPPAAGTEVVVTLRSGEEKSEVVGRVVWSGDDTRNGGTAWIATVQRNEQPQPPAPVAPPAHDAAADASILDPPF